MKVRKNYMKVMSLIALLGFTACGGGSSGGGVNPESSSSSRYAPNHVYDMADYLVTSRLSDEMSIYKYRKHFMRHYYTIPFVHDVELERLKKNEFLYTDTTSKGEKFGFITINKDTIEGKIGIGFESDRFFVRKRYLKVGDKYTFFKNLGLTLTCTLENHSDLFDIDDVYYSSGSQSHSEEEDVLKISCIYDGLKGKENLLVKEETFYVKGKGYIFSQYLEIEKGFKTVTSISEPKYDAYN